MLLEYSKNKKKRGRRRGKDSNDKKEDSRVDNMEERHWRKVYRNYGKKVRDRSMEMWNREKGGRTWMWKCRNQKEIVKGKRDRESEIEKILEKKEMERGTKDWRKEHSNGSRWLAKW